MPEGRKVISENRKARFDYFVEDSYECGIELLGTEVKSVKNGSISYPDGFAEINNGEVFLKNFHISEYSFSSIFNHNPDTGRKARYPHGHCHNRREISAVKRTPQ